jgi:hypothetical protein
MPNRLENVGPWNVVGYNGVIFFVGVNGPDTITSKQKSTGLGALVFISGASLIVSSFCYARGDMIYVPSKLTG